MAERPDFAAVLAEHDWRWAIRDSATGDGVRISCIGCEWYVERTTPDVDIWTAQLDHLAAALNAAVDAWLADEGTRKRVAAKTARQRATYAMNHAKTAGDLVGRILSACMADEVGREPLDRKAVARFAHDAAEASMRAYLNARETTRDLAALITDPTQGDPR